MRDPTPAPAERDRWTDKADITALLGSFCFFLSAIEYMIPKPLPFMRLGIANLPILLAVDILPLPWFLLLALIKVVGMSLISGSLFSYIAVFSLAGTMSAAIVMWLASKAGKSLISRIGVSVLGAVAANAVQILLATVLVFGRAAALIAPLFLGMGLGTGILLGVFSERFAQSSSWLARATGGEQPAGARAEGGASEVQDRKAGRSGGARALARAARKKERQERLARRRAAYEGLFDPRLLAAAGFALSISFLFQKTLGVRLVMFLIFLAAAAFSGKRVSPPATIIVMAGIILANLAVPSGLVLGKIGPLTITMTALFEGINKAVTFEGLILVSRATISGSLRLPGRFGGIVASAFVYYDRILEHRGLLKGATLMRDADALMQRVWEGPNAGPGSAESGAAAKLQGRLACHLVLAAAVLASCLLLA